MRYRHSARKVQRLLIASTCWLMLSVATHQVVGAASKWETCGRSLLKDGKAFFIRGVNYSPAPIGTSAGVDFLLRPELWQRDLPLLRSMHANAVKVYYYDASSGAGHNAFLDAAYNNGADPIYTVFMVWIPPYLMDDSVPLQDGGFAAVVENFRLMAQQTAGHPGTMGYSLGGETNFRPAIEGALYWQKMNTISAVIRSELAAQGAKKIITTTLIDDGGTTNFLGESFGADVDIWGTDIYRDTIEEVVLPAYRAVPGGKPLIFAEYGMSFASDYAPANDSEAQDISQRLTSYATALETNFLGKDTVGEAISAGGFVFAFSDEWWKDGNWFNHDFGSAPNPHYVLGINSEEYYGLFAVAKNQDPNQVDTLTPRPLVSMLTDLWSLPIDGFEVEGCGYTTSAPPTAAPTPTESQATTSPSPTSSIPSGTDAAAADTKVDQGANSSITTTTAPDASASASNQSNTSSSFAGSLTGGGATVAEVVISPTSTLAIRCFASRLEQAAGIAAFLDSTCSLNLGANSSIGCQKSGCRFCQAFETQRSVSFQRCPSFSNAQTTTSTTAGTTNSSASSGECAVDSFECSSGLVVARDPGANCSFAACPDPRANTVNSTCDAGVGNLRIGIGMYVDASCTVNGGGLGCDVARPNCRYCRDVAAGSGITGRASGFLPCPSTVVSTQSKTVANSSSTASCVISVGNANAGISILPDSSCLASAGGIGCAADQPGCRYCRLRLTWQSQHLVECGADALAATSASTQSLFSDEGESSGASGALIACAVVAAAVLAGVIAAVAYRAYGKRKRAKQRPDGSLSASLEHSIL